MLRINTFGGCVVRRDDGGEVAIPRRRLALLLAVVTAGSRGVSREKLLALLWPELDDERGRAALSQALYALRKDLGSEDAISGTADLRADPAQVTSDRAAFLAAIDRGDDAEAVMLYRGPYLDGFYVREAPEFEAAVETERQGLTARYAAALERLAEREGAAGDHGAAVRLWRQRANLDPTDASVAVQLMRALAAGGDQAGALRHAEVYAELVQHAAGLAPDPRVVACAEELRSGARGVGRGAPVVGRGSGVGGRESGVGGPASVATNGRGKVVLRWLVGAAALLLIVRLLPARYRTLPFGSGGAGRVVAVTEFQDFAGDSLTGPLAELLRTSLANIPGLSVISAERMADGRVRSPAAGGLAVAQAAGATEALNGALYRRPDGALRFDLRRVDPADGRVLEAFELEGRDVFVLTTEATRRLVERYGVRQLDGEVTTVSSADLTAIRLYQAGVDALYRGEQVAAYNLFQSALAEDPGFAMAEYYAALTAPNDEERGRRFDHAHQLALAASLRERLIIDANRADYHSDPALVSLAESLTTLFPRELSGQLALARARIFQEGDFLGAIPIYRRILATDSVGFPGIGRRCDACAGHAGLYFAYSYADSLAAAERAAVAWTRALPGDPSAWRYLALSGILRGDTILWHSGYARSDALVSRADRFGPEYYQAFYLGDLDRADAILTAWIRASEPAAYADLYWIQAQLRREQGRPRAAVAAIEQARRYMPGKPPYEAIFQAQLYFDDGRIPRALALWDSVTRLPSPTPSRAARGWVWVHTHMANAFAALGDTTRLRLLADSMHQQARGSGFARDRRLEHYVQGLYHAVRGDDRRALAEFREGVWSYTVGYTRANLEIGRAFLRLGQPRDAAQVCGSGLRGEMAASAQYVSRAELHECAARGWAAAGVPDSARAHLKVLLAQWAHPEPSIVPRRDSAAALLRSLGS